MIGLAVTREGIPVRGWAATAFDAGRIGPAALYPAWATADFRGDATATRAEAQALATLRALRN